MKLHLAIVSMLIAPFLSATAGPLPKCVPNPNQKLAIQVDGVILGFVKTVRLLHQTPDLTTPIVAVSLEEGLILDGSYFKDWRNYNLSIPKPVILEKHDMNIYVNSWNTLTGDFKLGTKRLILEEANIKALDLVQTDRENCYVLRKSTFLFDKLTKQ